MASLEDLLRRINRYRHSGKLSADQRDDIGQALDEVQAILPRGGFGPWIAQNMWFSYGMASYYMKCYRDGQVARRYENATKAHPDGPYAYDQNTTQPNGETKDMTADDYKKLVMYMRDNVTLTSEKAVLQRRVDQLMADARVTTSQLAAKDTIIRRLQVELQNEKNGSMFGNMFGGGVNLTKDEYRTLISALHPDRAMSDEQREKFTKASQIINNKLKV